MQKLFKRRHRHGCRLSYRPHRCGYSQVEHEPGRRCRVGSQGTRWWQGLVNAGREDAQAVRGGFARTTGLCLPIASIVNIASAAQMKMNAVIFNGETVS